MAGPLSDITILDLSSVISGPLATAILSDQGARIIKVESLHGDAMRNSGALNAGVSSMFSTMNRNKESIAVDLREASGIEIIKKLAAKADVCIQNYRPGVVEKLGIGYDDLKLINPEIVYASISGVGAYGPYSHRRVYDPVIQAYAGYSDAQRVNGRPDLIKMFVCDKVTSLTMAQAITAALYDRKNTGSGQHVEVSMLEACLYFIWPDRMMNQSFVEPPERPGGDMTTFYQTFDTIDGHITFITLQLDEFHGLCRGLGRNDWVEDPRFADLMSMYTHLAAFFPTLAAELKLWKTKDLTIRLDAEDVPYGVVLTGNEILDDPQIVAQEILKTYAHERAGDMRLVNRSARFSGSQTGMHTPAPDLSEHAEEILLELGYSKEEIEPLRNQGVVG